MTLGQLAILAFSPLPIAAPNTPPVIAPLWTRTSNLDVVFDNTLDYRVAYDQETLDMVTSMLADFNSELSRFQPMAAAIVTSFFAVSSFGVSERNNHVVLSWPDCQRQCEFWALP